MSTHESNGSGVAEEGGLGAAYVTMQESEAQFVLQERFGVRGTAKRLATEKDDTFAIRADDGARYVMKVANPSEDIDEVDFEISLIRHAGKADASLPLPRIVVSRQGRAYDMIVDAARQRRAVRLMTYLQGTPLDSTHSTPEGRERIGELLARLRLATADFAHRADDRVLAWDVNHLPDLAHLLERVQDTAQRAMLTKAFDRFCEMAPQFGLLRRQVLHNDFSRSNIIVDHDSPAFVTGIIDFGDAVKTSIAVDVSTALLNQLPRDAARNPVSDLFAQGKDVLRGYLRHADLTDEELRAIPHLAMGRVVARALITLWRARMFPVNETYILRNTEQGWAQLEWFLARSVDEISNTLSRG